MTLNLARASVGMSNRRKLQNLILPPKNILLQLQVRPTRRNKKVQLSADGGRRGRIQHKAFPHIFSERKTV